MGRLQDKTAVIFGGTGAIGSAIAHGFVKEGASVIVTSRNRNKIEATSQTLKEAGNRCGEIIPCDISDRNQVQSFCANITDTYGRIDIMVCASGVYLKKPAQDISLEEWNYLMNINLTGTFITNQVVGKIMLSQGSGSIINIGSLGSVVALSNTLPYCVSKSGVAMLTQCLSSEWCEQGVRVNTLIPGVFPTDLNRVALSDPLRLKNILRRTPMARLGEVSELAGAAVFLASDESSFVTGISLPVDGGFLADSGF